MLAANILALLILAPWAGLLMIGMLLIQGVANRHIPNYPSGGQIWFCIGMPGAVFIFVLSALVIFNFVKRSPWLLAVSAGASLLFLVRYLYMLAAIAAI